MKNVLDEQLAELTSGDDAKAEAAAAQIAAAGSKRRLVQQTWPDGFGRGRYFRRSGVDLTTHIKEIAGLLFCEDLSDSGRLGAGANDATPVGHLQPAGARCQRQECRAVARFHPLHSRPDGASLRHFRSKSEGIWLASA